MFHWFKRIKLFKYDNISIKVTVSKICSINIKTGELRIVYSLDRTRVVNKSSVRKARKEGMVMINFWPAALCLRVFHANDFPRLDLSRVVSSLSTDGKRQE